jgi:hypothetical protein
LRKGAVQTHVRDAVFGEGVRGQSGGKARREFFTYNTVVRVKSVPRIQEDVLVFGWCISNVHVPRPAATRQAHIVECSRWNDRGAKWFDLRGWEMEKEENS